MMATKHLYRFSFASIFACASLAAFPASAQITDVTSLINAVNNGADNSTVVVGVGTFLLPSSLKPKPGMTIQGAGLGQTILAPASSWVPSTADLPDDGSNSSTINPTAYLFDLGGNDRIHISGMTLRGSSRLHGAALHGAAYGNNADNLEFASLLIEDFLWCGIRTFLMGNSSIHDCEFVDAGGRWSEGLPGENGGVTGGAIYVTSMADSEIWNNRFTRTLPAPERNFFGIKGRLGKTTRIHHNTIGVQFSIEFPFENDESMEIDHNACSGTLSLPKSGGGPIPASGWSFHIHHNWLTRSYALEWPRNAAEIDHNLFDFSTSDDTGNLITKFGSETANGPTVFHNNLVKNPGRGVFSTSGIFGNISFVNNHIIANTTTTPRTEGLFGFNSATNFSTIVIKDNIIQCNGQSRPLLRNGIGNTANIANNTLTNVSDTAKYSNPDTGAPRGPLQPLLFTCGVNGESTVNGWNTYATPTGAPTNIALSNASVWENQPVGTIVGTLSTTDPNDGETQVYTLSGSDAAAFGISRNKLVTAASFDYETKSSYSVTVRSTDVAGLYVEKAFAISVIDLRENVSTTRDANGFVTFGADGTAYGSGKDGNPPPTTLVVPADGNSAILLGNAWKKFPLTYTVTANTVLEFTLYASNTGKIVGVALDNNNINTDGTIPRAVRVAGSDVGEKSWSWKLTPFYNANEPARKFVIPIGSHFTGSVSFLGLIADDDPDASANVTFSSIRLYESAYTVWSLGINWGAIPVDQRGPDGDPDGDGDSNFLERAFGGNPTQPDGQIGRVLLLDNQPDGSMLLTQKYKKAASDLSYQFKWSTGLSIWSATGVSAEQLETPPNLYYRTYLFPAGTLRGFGRLEVTSP